MSGTTFSIVAVSGSPSAPSKTTALVRTISEAFASAITADVSVRVIELPALLPGLVGGPDHPAAAAVRDALDAVESADLVIAGSPAYRATYSGAFKLFFDYVDQYALTDTPVLLSATGGSERHALLVEHQLRPLFGFFQALVLPIGIYAVERDFTDGEVSSLELSARIAKAVDKSLPLLDIRAEHYAAA